MNLDAGGIQRDGFDADANHLLALQLLEHSVQHASLLPTTHARVDGVPVAKFLGQSTPFAALLGHIQYGVEHLQVGHAHVATLPGKAMLDSGELFCCDFQARKCLSSDAANLLVLTSPNQKASAKFAEVGIRLARQPHKICSLLHHGGLTPGQGYLPSTRR
jgi:hypothetical protein